MVNTNDKRSQNTFDSQTRSKVSHRGRKGGKVSGRDKKTSQVSSDILDDTLDKFDKDL